MEDIKELVNKLNRWNYEYYTLGNAPVSDKLWDEEYSKLLKLEKETGVILPNSPSQKIGSETLKGFEKVQHKNKLWSLDKRQSLEEVRQWLIICENFVKEYNKTHNIKLPQPKYLVLKKFDGLTVKTKYVKDSYEQASSRGTGIIGDDFTKQVKTTINLPLELNHNDNRIEDISFHGEELMTKKSFEEYNKTAQTPLKNLRNGIAGALRNLDVSETAKRKPIIYFYNINEINDEIGFGCFKTYQEQLDYIKFRGLPVADYDICNTYEEVIQAINNIEKERPYLAYDIDGSVITINDLMTQQAMSYTIKFPKFSLAYKYEAEETTTKLIGVEWNTSRQGKTVPTGLLEPVELGGTTVKRATLNNLDDIERKVVKINSEIFIRRSNDVIPEVMGVVEESLNNLDVEDIIPPSKCPSCGADTEIRQDNKTRYVYCTNTMSCKSQLSKSIDHYCSRQAMNIVGLSEKTIEKFIELGILKSIADIYILKKDNNKELILKQEGFQLPSYNKLIKAIEESKKCKLPSFIFALGIANVGIKTAQTLVEFVKGETPLDTINNILQLKIKDLIKMDDCGEVVANSIYNWFHDSSNIEVLGYLTQIELTFIEDKPKEVIITQQTPFQGKKVYPTGSFNIKKQELKELLESLGAIVETGYKVKLDYLICGHDMSKSGKDKKAMDDNASGKSNITIINENEFLQIIKGN